MDAWDGWPFARVYLLLLAVGFLSLGVQVFFHWRAGFSRLTMYGPVLLVPVLALAALVASIVRTARSAGSRSSSSRWESSPGSWASTST